MWGRSRARSVCVAGKDRLTQADAGRDCAVAILGRADLAGIACEAIGASALAAVTRPGVRAVGIGGARGRGINRRIPGGALGA